MAPRGWRDWGPAMPERATPRFARGLRDLADHYDRFLLDQYGVLHDGVHAYPGAAEALRALRRLGKHIDVLTNSGRSSAHNLARIVGKGFEPDLFDRVISSGDLALDWLHDERQGAPCFPFCLPQDVQILRDVGLNLVSRVEEAEIIVLNVLPLPVDEISEQAVAPVLDAGVAKGALMVCGNPDMRGPQGGRVVITPGQVAAWYEARGGTVRYFGKPYPEVFRAALDGSHAVSADRTAMVGDTPETDLTGAAEAGIAGVFVLGGVHAERFQGLDEAARAETAQRLLSERGAHADWVLPSLVW